MTRRAMTALFASATRRRETVQCSYQARTGTDEYGAPTYGAIQYFEGILAQQTQRHTLAPQAGPVHLPTGELLLLSTPVVATDGQLTLTDGTVPVLLAAVHYEDALGVFAQKVVY